MVKIPKSPHGIFWMVPKFFLDIHMWWRMVHIMGKVHWFLWSLYPRQVSTYLNDVRAETILYKRIRNYFVHFVQNFSANNSSLPYFCLWGLEFPVLGLISVGWMMYCSYMYCSYNKPSSYNTAKIAVRTGWYLSCWQYAFYEENVQWTHLKVLVLGLPQFLFRGFVSFFCMHLYTPPCFLLYFYGNHLPLLIVCFSFTPLQSIMSKI